MPQRVTITESSPRDGLQSLGTLVPTEAKVALIDELADAGARSFDAVSFVNPKAVPQMADAAEVLRGVRRRDDLVLFGLVPNQRGLEAALAAGVGGVAVLTAASDTFNLRNINADVEESMRRIAGIVARIPADVPTRGYVSTATHCPYEGEQPPEKAAVLASRLLDMGVERIFLGDTLGMATPAHTERLLAAVLDRVPADRLGVHLHDTYGQAVANTVVALEHGISRMDSSAGGLGGCPYAPGATGNVATEDLIWLLDGLDVDHGLHLLGVARAAWRFCRDHGLAYNSAAGRAELARAEVGAR